MRANAATSTEFPGARSITKRLAGQGAHRADIDHVAREFALNGPANKGHDLGVLAAIGHTELHNPRNFLTKANTTRAMNAARHFLRRDKRTHGLMKDNTLGLGVLRGRGPIAHSQILQLALAALIADGAVKRMVDQQKLHDTLLGKLGFLGGCEDLHARGNRCGTGWQWLGCLLDFNKAHAAVGRNGEFLVIAEVRNVEAQLMGGLHNHTARRHLDLLAVDFEFNHSHGGSPDRFCEQCDARTRCGSS